MMLLTGPHRLIRHHKQKQLKHISPNLLTFIKHNRIPKSLTKHLLCGTNIDRYVTRVNGSKSQVNLFFSSNSTKVLG